jgi:hypothetical protein
VHGKEAEIPTSATHPMAAPARPSDTFIDGERNCHLSLVAACVHREICPPLVGLRKTRPCITRPGIRRIAIGGESAADPPKNRHERYRRGPGCNWTMPSGALPQSADAHCAVSKTPRHASNGLRRFLGGRQLRTPPKKKRTAHPRWRPLDSGSVHLSMKAIYFQTTSGLSPWPYD